MSEGGRALLGAGRFLGDAMGAIWDRPLLAAGSAFVSVLMARWAARLVRRWRDWQHARRLRGAKEILLLAPAEVDAEGVNLWWAQVAGLLRRRGWRRLVYGPPHLGFELRWSGRELTIVIWVPGTMGVRPVAAAARAAWPGITATVRDAQPPLDDLRPPTAPAGSHASAGAMTAPVDVPEGFREGLPVGLPEGQPGGQRKPPRQDGKGRPADAHGASDGVAQVHGDATAELPRGRFLLRIFDRLVGEVGPGTSGAVRRAASPHVSTAAKEGHGEGSGASALHADPIPDTSASTVAGRGPARAKSARERSSRERSAREKGTRESTGQERLEAGRILNATMPGWYVFADRSRHRVDPMRAVIEQASTLRAGQSACVQILVRSPSRRLVRRLRAGAVALKTGQSGGSWFGGSRVLGSGVTGVLGAVLALAAGVLVALTRTAVEVLLDVIEAMLSSVSGARSHRSGAGSRSGRGTGTGTSAVRRAGTHPLQDQDARPGLEKVRTGLLWEVSIRIAVTQTVQIPPPSTMAGASLSNLPGVRLVTRPARPRQSGRSGQGEKAQNTAALQARERVMADLRSYAHALSTALGVHDDRNGLRAWRLRDPARVLEQRRMDGHAGLGRVGAVGVVMGSAELASLAALPTDVAVAGLDRAQSRIMPAPTGVADGGRAVKVLGRSGIDGRSVGLSVVDGRQHVHVLGSTGVGKSTLLCRQILADINARRGVVLIDPKGDLALDVLARMPAHAVNRVTLIDPDQPGGSAGFNPLQVRPGVDPALQADNLAAIFASIFAKHWGPRIDDTLRVACLTLMRYPNARLTLIPALLSNKRFRAPLTVDLTDSAGLGGYWEWYESTPPALRAQVIGPVLARLRAFLLRDFARFTIGRAQSTFDMGRILDGGILIARIPKGQLGEDASKLLGSMLLASVWQAASARAAIPEEQRRDATVYTDEAHNILHLSGAVTDMLAEARAYRLSFVLAHQNLSQLSTEVQQAISANARNKIYFSCSPEDASQLARHTLPELDDRDLSHLGPFTAAARLLAGNREMRAFTLLTSPMPAPDPAARERVRAHVRATGPTTAPDDLPAETDTHDAPDLEASTGAAAGAGNDGEIDRDDDGDDDGDGDGGPPAPGPVTRHEAGEARNPHSTGTGTGTGPNAGSGTGLSAGPGRAPRNSGPGRAGRAGRSGQAPGGRSHPRKHQP